MPAKIITVMSPKGGVGKTTVSVNIAAALSVLGNRVLIVDANLETPHVAVYYGLVGYKYSLEDVLNGKIGIVNAIYKTDFPGLSILPSRVFKDKGDGNAKYKLINLFYHLNRISEDFDFIILDSKPSSSVDFLRFVKNVNTLLVSMPEIASIIEAKKLDYESRASGVNVLGLVLNRVNKKVKGAMSEDEIKKVLEIEKIWEVPDDLNVFEALKAGTPIVFQNKRSPASKGFNEIAKDLLSI